MHILRVHYFSRLPSYYVENNTILKSLNMYWIPAANKEGQCPRREQDDNCDRECEDDSDCTLDLKCCSTGCGTICSNPAAREPSPLVTLPIPTEAPCKCTNKSYLPKLISIRHTCRSVPVLQICDEGKNLLIQKPWGSQWIFQKVCLTSVVLLFFLYFTS